jgi:CubicO group peptidase (beta-lactamase class C family)
MSNTSWRLAGIDRTHLATQYDEQHGKPVAVPAFSYIEYPSGSIRTSVDQLAKFLLMFMNGGVYDGVRILSERSIAEMERRQIPRIEDSQALVWYYMSVGRDQVIGHEGRDTGSGCYMFYRPSDKAGVIFLMNLRYDDDAAALLARRLFDFASTGH